MQERHNSIASALELCLSCTNPSMWQEIFMHPNFVVDTVDSVITWSNITCYCIQQCKTYKPYIELTKDTPYVTLVDKLWAAYHQYLGEIYCGIIILWPHDIIWHRLWSINIGWQMGSVTFTKSNFKTKSHKLNPCHVFRTYTFKITTMSPRGQWVNVMLSWSIHCWTTLQMDAYMEFHPDSPMIPAGGLLIVGISQNME